MALDKIKNNRKLEQTLLKLIDVLHINMLVVDPKGSPVLTPETSGHGFYGAAQWGVLQYLGKPDFLSKFQKEGDYLKSVDHFGFQTFAIPVAAQGSNPAAYLIAGPVVLNKPYEQSRNQAIAQELEVNFSNFLECLNEVRVVSFNSLKSILDLLSELSQYAFKMEDTLNLSIFKILLDLSMGLAQAECGSIMLLNNLTNELSIQVFRGINPQKIPDAPVKLGEGIAGLAAQQKESFVINGERANNRIRHLLKKPELKCAVVLPIMKSNQEVLGVMNISTREAKSRLATHSRQMLKSLSELTSATISSLL